jgi:hypothetical protein
VHTPAGKKCRDGVCLGKDIILGGIGKTVPEVLALRVGEDSFHEMAQRVQRAAFIMSRDDCTHPRDTADISTYAKRKWEGPWWH